MNNPMRSTRTGRTPGRQQPRADLSAAVIERVARGDKRAFEDLYHHLAGPVFGMALRTLRDRAHAEEVAQEVLLEIWRTAATYRSGRGSVTTWALTIAHRRAVDRVRSVRASTERDDRIARQDPAHSEPLEDRVVRSIEQARVRSALAGLSHVQREAVVLAYYGGYSQREIADLTHTPLGTVKTRVRDSLIRLRTALGLESSSDDDSQRPTATAAMERKTGGAW
ncbi:sigma-70 family RNA polymerase sigma factor [Kitasatospora sp. NPDC101801]|uniref:sigma-70 family RNA polymerase sigma factor n=1 Tax=Kitasatospora sp. NPDC101801 TaxID=3364103 RepID=UPI0037FD5332